MWTVYSKKPRGRSHRWLLEPVLLIWLYPSISLLMSIPAANLTDAQVQRLRQLVYDRTGIWYADRKLYLLGARASTHMAELEVGAFEGYMRAITTDIDSDTAFRSLCDRVTINETSFFRDRRQLGVFENHVLRRLIKARAGARRLRIWSAACSTGEEPYTLAMIVRRQLGAEFANWDIEILGTDLSEAALKVARSGVYVGYALRTLDADQRAAFFTESQGGGLAIAPEIRRMVRFDHQNLVDAVGLSRRGVWDVIFCRNVLIYFDDASRYACITRFRNLIAPDGSLFLGHSESMNSRTDFSPLGEPGGFAWAPHPTPNRMECSHVA